MILDDCERTLTALHDALDLTLCWLCRADLWLVIADVYEEREAFCPGSLHYANELRYLAQSMQSPPLIDKHACARHGKPS